MSKQNEENKSEVIYGLGKDPENKLSVQKSKPLTALWASSLSLSEFKLLDLYLARINSRHPEQRTVVLTKSEIQEALGIKNIQTTDLLDRILKLGQPIKIPDKSKKNGFRIMWLLEEAECSIDQYGRWTVRLEASSKAMDLFFNIEDLGYFRYKLRNIAGLTSRYSYILFMHIEENRYRKTWETNLDELRRILCCQGDESYKKFGVFNDRVLKRSYKELMEKTECRFIYEPVRKAKTVVAVRFTVEKLKKEQIPGQIKNEDNNVIPEENEEKINNTGIDELTETLKKCEYIPSTIPKEKIRQKEELIYSDEECNTFEEDDDYIDYCQEEEIDYREMIKKHQEALKNIDKKMEEEKKKALLPPEPIRDPEDPLKIVSDACSVMDENEHMVPEFTQEQMGRLRDILDEVPRYKLPRALDGTKGVEAQRYRYLVEKYRELEYDNSQFEINNRYGYLYGLIEKDAFDDNYHKNS